MYLTKGHFKALATINIQPLVCDLLITSFVTSTHLSVTLHEFQPFERLSIRGSTPLRPASNPNAPLKRMARQHPTQLQRGCPKVFSLLGIYYPGRLRVACGARRHIRLLLVGRSCRRKRDQSRNLRKHPLQLLVRPQGLAFIP